MKNITIDIDANTSDRITVLNLKEYRAYLKKELAQHKKGEGMLHEDDVENNKNAIKALDLIIKYYT